MRTGISLRRKKVSISDIDETFHVLSKHKSPKILGNSFFYCNKNTINKTA